MGEAPPCADDQRVPSERQYELSAPLVFTNHTIGPTIKIAPGKYQRPVRPDTGFACPRASNASPIQLGTWTLAVSEYIPAVPDPKVVVMPARAREVGYLNPPPEPDIGIEVTGSVVVRTR